MATVSHSRLDDGWEPTDRHTSRHDVHVGEPSRDEGVWIGDGGLAVSRWAAIATVLLFGVASGWAALDVATSDHPIALGAGALLMIGVAVLFLPTAVWGRRRSAGIRLVAVVLLLLFAPAMIGVAVAAQLEPEWFDPGRARDQVMRVASPGFAALFLGVGLWLFRLSFRTIKPTDYAARHAERD